MVEPIKKDEPLWKSDHQDSNALKKFFGLIILLIIIGIVIVSIYFLTLPPETKTIYSDLEVDSIQVQRSNDVYVDDNTTSTDLEVVIYLTNNGELDSGEVKIDAYIKSYDTRGIETLWDSNDSISMDEVVTDTTSKTIINFKDLRIKHDETYKIDFIIMEDNKIVEKSSTTIKVPFFEVEPEPDVDYSQDADKKPGKSEDDIVDSQVGMPGFESAFLIAAFIVAIFIVKNRRIRR